MLKQNKNKLMTTCLGTVYPKRCGRCQGKGRSLGNKTHCFPWGQSLSAFYVRPLILAVFGQVHVKPSNEPEALENFSRIPFRRFNNLSGLPRRIQSMFLTHGTQLGPQDPNALQTWQLRLSKNRRFSMLNHARCSAFGFQELWSSMYEMRTLMDSFT